MRWFTDVAARRRSSTTGRRRRRRIAEPLYLQRVAIPACRIFARLVPLGEIVSGSRWWPVSGRRSFAFVAFFMALNFQFASGALFRYSFSDQRLRLAGLGVDARAAVRRSAIGGDLGRLVAPSARNLL
jgi:hypothetical protein